MCQKQEIGDRYLVQSRAVDLFKPEREAQKRLK